MKTTLLILCAACPLVLCHVLVKRQEEEDNGARFTGFKEASSGGGAYSGNFSGFKADGAEFSQFSGSGEGSSFSKNGGGSGFSSPGPRSREVAPGVYSFTSTGFTVSMFVVTEAGVMVVDPMDPAHAAALLAEIRRVTAAPVRFLFYSHNHWDHVRGGRVFREAGAVIVSHAAARDYIAANPTEDLELPDQTWAGARAAFTLGNTTLELHYLGLSHGHGMTCFVLPRQKVIKFYLFCSLQPPCLGWLPR